MEKAIVVQKSELTKGLTSLNFELSKRATVKSWQDHGEFIIFILFYSNRALLQNEINSDPEFS